MFIIAFFRKNFDPSVMDLTEKSQGVIKLFRTQILWRIISAYQF